MYCTTHNTCFSLHCFQFTCFHVLITNWSTKCTVRMEEVKAEKLTLTKWQISVFSSLWTWRDQHSGTASHLVIPISERQQRQQRRQCRWPRPLRPDPAKIEIIRVAPLPITPPRSHKTTGPSTRHCPTSSGRRLTHHPDLSLVTLQQVASFRSLQVCQRVFLPGGAGRASWGSWIPRETSPSWRARWNQATSSTTSSIATAPQTSRRTSTGSCRPRRPWRTSTTGAAPSWATLASCSTAAAAPRSTRTTSSSGFLFHVPLPTPISFPAGCLPRWINNETCKFNEGCYWNGLAH